MASRSEWIGMGYIGMSLCRIYRYGIANTPRHVGMRHMGMRMDMRHTGMPGYAYRLRKASFVRVGALVCSDPHSLTRVLPRVQRDRACVCSCGNDNGIERGD